MKKKVLSLLLALCLIVGLLPLAAMAEEAAPEVYTMARLLDNAGNKIWDENVPAGAATKYAVTSAEGAITEGTADNWNIKLEYPADGKPTLTLKGATLAKAITIGGNVDITVKVETDSTINVETKGAGFSIANSGITTITGPGKLSISTYDGSCLLMSAHVTNLTRGTTVIKDANLDLSPNGESTNQPAILFYGGDLTIEGSKIHLDGKNKTVGIWGYASYTKDAEGKVTKVASTWKKGVNDTTPRKLTIVDSEITGVIRGRNSLGANGDVTIKNSTLDLLSISLENNMPVFDKKPIFEGEMTVVGGADKSKTEPYDASNYASYLYIKATPKASSGGTTGGTTGTTPSNPQTADTFNVVLVSGLALASMASLAAVTVLGKKKAI